MKTDFFNNKPLIVEIQTQSDCFENIVAISLDGYNQKQPSMTHSGID